MILSLSLPLRPEGLDSARQRKRRPPIFRGARLICSVYDLASASRAGFPRARLLRDRDEGPVRRPKSEGEVRKASKASMA